MADDGGSIERDPVAGGGGRSDGAEPPRPGARVQVVRRVRPVTSLAGCDDTRPLHQIVRSWSWAPWLASGLLLLRVLAVAGMRLYLYFDSAEYDRLDFSGTWRRPWATPYLYWLIPGSNRWIVIGQAVLGAVCWCVLALSAAAWFRARWLQATVAVVLAGLACTTIVTNWDAAKLSESLGLSLTVLVIAAWLNLARRTEVLTAVFVALATFPWLFVRQSLIPTAWLVVGAGVVVALVVWRRAGRDPHPDRRRFAARVLGGLCLVLAVLVGLASASYSRNQEIVHENLLVIVSNRVATDPGRLAWFTDHGMPVPSTGSLDPDSLRSDPAFSDWVAHDGRGTYLRYLLTHPWYTATEPLDDFAGVRQSSADEQKPSTAMLAPPDSYATSRPVLPSIVEQVLFDPGDTGTAIAGLVVVLGWTLIARRRRGAAWTIPLLLVALSISSLYTGWHGATPELGRLALVGAIGLRIGLLLQLAFLVEGEVLRRRGAGALDGSAVAASSSATA